jgi:hypothetical protein
MVLFLVLLLRVMSLLQKKSTKNHHTQSHLSLLLSLTCVSLRLFSLHFVREEKKKFKTLLSLSLLLWRHTQSSSVACGGKVVGGGGGVCVPKSTLSHSHSLTLTL